MALNIEEKLWAMADKLRNNMESSEYKHVVLGLLFLKYISDRFAVRYEELVSEGEDTEDKDQYIAENVFYVPVEARWQLIQTSAKTPQIGRTIDDALRLIEKENPSLKNVLDKRYAKEDLSSNVLGGLIDIISDTTLYTKSDTDILGRVYEYFLGKFASKEGKLGGEFYTPACIVKVLVNMLEPYAGRVYDPCCGSGGMFVQSGKFVEEHAGRLDDISVYGQESNPTTWRLCKMNLAIRGIEANLGKHFADTIIEDLHRNDKFDFILANPPFNVSDWGGDKLSGDVRFKFGNPPDGNANYAWLQHIFHHLSNAGVAGVVLANGSLSAGGQEGAIRKTMLENDCVDCIVALPSQLFYSVQIPACLWIMRKDKTAHSVFKQRKGEVLFIDARNMGSMITRSVRELDKDDITKIADIYHSWRNVKGKYKDIAGFCKSAKLEEITSHDYTLTPGRYVGTSDTDDNIDFDSEIKRLGLELTENMNESKKLDEQIKNILKDLGV